MLVMVERQKNHKIGQIDRNNVMEMYVDFSRVQFLVEMRRM